MSNVTKWDTINYSFPPDEASWKVLLKNADLQYRPYTEKDLV